MATLDEFLAAERSQESGGNYTVVNSIGALGAYQIMTGNLPSWSKAALGHSISKSEFLSHPSEQDAIARYELGPKFTKYGPEGAAAWWYSGQTDPTKTYGNPPVYKYVAEVMAKLGKSGSVTGGSTSGSTSATPADNTSGSTVTTAGLQQAGYDAVIDLTPWGIPLNPFKLPGYAEGKLRGLAGSAGGAAGSAISGALADTIGPILLASIGIATGGVLLIVGLYLTAKPALDKGTEQAAQLAPLAA